MANIEKKYCAECGSEIVFDLIRPTLSFKVENSGVVRDQRRDLFINFGETTEVEFLCSKDKNHNVFPLEDDEYVKFDMWVEEVCEEIFKKYDEYSDEEKN